MNDELQKQLTQLALKLGTTVDHLWSVMVKQAAIDSTVYFLSLTVLIIVTCVLWKRFSNAKVNESGDGEVFKCSMLILSVLMLLVTFLFLVCGLSEALSGFFNPEYWALQDLLSKIHGD